MKKVYFNHQMFAIFKNLLNSNNNAESISGSLISRIIEEGRRI